MSDEQTTPANRRNPTGPRLKARSLRPTPKTTSKSFVKKPLSIAPRRKCG